MPSGSPHHRSVEAKPPPAAASAPSRGPSARVPSPAGPGPPLLLSPRPPRAPLQARRPRSPLSMILPRWSHGLGCLGRWFWGEGSDICFIFFVAATRQVLMPRGLSAPGGRCRGPTGCSPGSLRSNWPPPLGPGSSRRPCVGSVGREKTGFSGSPGSGQGASLPQGQRRENRLAQNSKIASWVTRPLRAAHGTCRARLSSELVQVRLC